MEYLIQARYEVLVNRANDVEGSKPGNVEFDMSSMYDKDLEAALDSFDNLFCRRCLVSIVILLIGCRNASIITNLYIGWVVV